MNSNTKPKGTSLIEKLLRSSEEKKGIERIQYVLHIIFLCLFNIEQLKRKMNNSVFSETEMEYQNRLSKIYTVTLFFEFILRNNADNAKKKPEKKSQHSSFFSFLRYSQEKESLNEEAKIKKMDGDALFSFGFDGVFSEISRRISEKGINPSQIRSLLLLGWEEAAAENLLLLEREKKSKSSKLVLRPIARQTLSFLKRAKISPKEIGATEDYLLSFLN